LVSLAGKAQTMQKKKLTQINMLLPNSACQFNTMAQNLPSQKAAWQYPKRYSGIKSKRIKRAKPVESKASQLPQKSINI